MTKSETIAERLKNMTHWTMEDFIFYADMFDQIFVFNVEFDPKKPEIGWELFKQKLEAANKEFDTTGDVIAFHMIDDIDAKVRNQ